MAEKNLARLLSGEALDIPKERLDTQGWDAAFQAYQGATMEERLSMESDLAKAIENTNDWSLVADAILLARSEGIRMDSPSMRSAIRSAGTKWAERMRRILTEAERYLGDVPEPAHPA